jgi:hypothetical protein
MNAGWEVNACLLQACMQKLPNTKAVAGFELDTHALPSHVRVQLAMAPSCQVHLWAFELFLFSLVD